MIDVVVVGSGAGGGALAWALSHAGLRVLVLEKGRRYDRADFTHDEIARAVSGDMFVPRIDADPHVLVEAERPDRPTLTNLGWTASCLGGGTVHMGACLYRFHEDDFRLRSRFGPFQTIEDWPCTYADLEPYYCRVERVVGIAGSRNGTPLEAFRTKPIPMPPLRQHPLAGVLQEACRRRGVQPFHTPRAINSRPYDGRPECQYCNVCAGYGCQVGARGSVPETFLRRALGTGRCTVRTQTMVREVTVDGRPRATGCICVDRRGREHRVRARIVCVCCSAVESARLLLLSRSAHFPDGLANSSGLVGRHLQFHTVSGGRALFRNVSRAGTPAWDGSSLLGVSIADYYFADPRTLAWPKGGLLRFDLRRLQPIAVAQSLARRSGELLWGEPLKRRLTEHFTETREAEFEVFQDFVPNDETFVDLDPTVTDKWGLPAARMHVRQVAHHAEAGEWLVNRGLEILEAAGATAGTAQGVGRISHAMVHGTCRAGRDPRRSVLNEFCQAHDVGNLFVVDGSFMPTSGGAPSTLTIMANALRVADYVLDEARTGAFG